MTTQKMSLTERISHLVNGRLSPERAEIWREGITMSLYISLSQLAVISAFPTETAESDFSLAWAIALTSVGLVMAHQVAFRMSSRLIAANSELHSHAGRILTAQLIGGAFVTAVALVPALIFGNRAFFISLGALFIYVMAVGYLIARSRPTSQIRSIGYVVSIAIAVVAILFVKNLVGH
jgi:hypothetical protein